MSPVKRVRKVAEVLTPDQLTPPEALHDLASHTRRTQNTARLVAHLRFGGAVDQGLRDVIADILDGSLAAHRRDRHPVFGIPPAHLKRLVRDLARMLHPNNPIRLSGEEWDHVERTVRDAGYSGPLPCRGQEATQAASLVIAKRYQATVAQLDEAKSPRTSRRKLW